MKRTLFLLLFLLLTLAATTGCRGDKTPDATAPQDTAAAIDTTALLVSQVTQCARLYTTEYHVHKLVRFTDDSYLDGKLGSTTIHAKVSLGERKIVIPIDATVKAYIDFADFSAANVERDRQHVTLTLPDPKVELTATKIDNAGVRQYVDLTRSNFSDADILRLSKQGEDSISAHIDRTDILKRARQSAAEVLLPMLKRLGYADTQATVTFRSDLRPADIKLIKN